MDFNYVRRFCAYVSIFYHSEYITIQDILGMNADLRINQNWIPDTMTVILI